MKGDVVLVTGSSEGGIGYALCKAFAAKQCRVFASARRLEAMEGLLGTEKTHLLSSSQSVHAGYCRRGDDLVICFKLDKLDWCRTVRLARDNWHTHSITFVDSMKNSQSAPVVM